MGLYRQQCKPLQIHAAEELPLTRIVVEAPNADEAFEILERRCDIRRVFTGINGSGSGVHLSEAILRTAGHQHILLLPSGVP